jgi:cytochrome c oxidase assembly protein subunit 15
VKFHTALALLVILVGTLVTGSGPHAGDVAKITRLPFDPQMISWLHADLVLLFIGLTIGLIVAAKSTKLEANVSRAATGVLQVSLLQGLIGYVQYFSGLPWLIVALHIAGSCLVWLASLRLLYSTRSFS